MCESRHPLAMSAPTENNAPRARPVLLVVGTALVACASTLLGIGGGAFLVPLLAAWGPLRMKKSVGTSLAVIAGVVAVGLVAQLATRPADISWPLVGLLVVGAFGGAPVGRFLLRILPRQAFRYVFAAFLLLVAVRMFGFIPAATGLLGRAPRIDALQTIVYSLGTGFLAGVTSTLFGIGGGMVIVPALMIGYRDLSEHFVSARATSLAAIVPISAWGTFLHWKKGNVRVAFVPRLLPLAVGFAVLGVVASYWLEARVLTFVFGPLLLGIPTKVALAKPRANVPDDDEAAPGAPS